MSLLMRLEKQKNEKLVTQKRQQELNGSHETDPLRKLKVMIHEQLINEIDTKLLKLSEKSSDKQELKEKVGQVVQRVIADEELTFTRTENQQIMSQIIDEVVGFGPITSLIQDTDVSEIMVNGPKQIFVERNGRLELTQISFRDHDHVLHIIDKIVAPLGRRIDESSPMVDARLPDGSRVNAIIPPLALNGPTLTIRKFAANPLTVENLIEFETLTVEMAEFIKACVKARLNIIVSGGTGSGKTTLLNILSSFIPGDERIVTIEDAAELQLRQEHVVSLESRPPNVEGKGGITIRDLVRNSLRMRPDRIVIGEVRGGEALDMLQAMNTGHDGSLTTGHANSSRDMLSRLETMVLMAGMDLPVRAIREQIASAIDLIIQQARLRDGKRKIVKITEVLGMEGEIITLQDIFTLERGALKPTGIRPKLFEQIIDQGIELPTSLFSSLK